MRHHLRTLKSYGQATLEINRSLFIAHAARTENEQEALDFAAQIRKKYPDATHNCFACIVGTQDEFQKADDDGEPSGTAGKPMIEVIRKNRLCDSSIVITRYFGGIKLGSGGLIRAYGKSACEGIRAAGIVERILHSCLGIEIDYSLLGPLENQLRLQHYTIQDKQYAERIRLLVLVENGKEPELQKLATDLSAGTALFSDQGVAYVEKDPPEVDLLP